MSRPVEIAPSILSADFSRLGEQIRLVEPYAGRIHVDVMDGHFVPNLSMGPMVVDSIRSATTLPIEVHLMVEDPGMFVDPFLGAGADRLIFHVEVAEDAGELAGKIRSAGAPAGLAIKPGTPLEQALLWLNDVDLVIVMTVEPGFGGQAFMEEMLPKVARARREVNELGIDVDIEVDGGIDLDTAVRARDAGANVFVAGNAIFETPDPEASVRALAGALGG